MKTRTSQGASHEATSPVSASRPALETGSNGVAPSREDSGQTPPALAIRALLDYGDEEKTAAIKRKDRDNHQFWGGWVDALQRVAALLREAGKEKTDGQRTEGLAGPTLPSEGIDYGPESDTWEDRGWVRDPSDGSLGKYVEKACRFNCDAESACKCWPHELYRAAIALLREAEADQAREELQMKDDPLNYDDLDPGIRETVRLLRQHGFVTTDSGDGVTKPKEARIFEVPHVCAQIHPHVMIRETHRLAALLPGWRIECSYSPDEPAILLATKPALAGLRAPAQAPKD